MLVSKGRASRQTSEIHFKSLIQEIDKSEYIVVSASKNLDSKSFQVYNLRNYYFLVIFFTLIKKKVIIMTTPDLNNFYLKKTPSNRYVYLHHSMCSTHMIYNPKAFDNFDYIFNVGEYQNLEIKEREKIYKLKKKNYIIMDMES